MDDKELEQLLRIMARDDVKGRDTSALSMDKIKRILKQCHGAKFTVYVGSTPFEVDLDKLRPWTGEPLKLKKETP